MVWRLEPQKSVDANVLDVLTKILHQEKEVKLRFQFICFKMGHAIIVGISERRNHALNIYGSLIAREVKVFIL